MASTHSDSITPPAERPLRLWPGVVLAVVLLLLRFVLPRLMPEALPTGVIGSVVCALAIVVWWLGFSRARWSDRLGALAVMALALWAASRFIHKSIAGGIMGYMFPMYAIPTVAIALVLAAVATRHRALALRRASMAAAIALAAAAWTLVRTGGFTSGLDHDWAWRWTPTPEERLVARGPEQPKAPAPAPSAAAASAEWPGFRGSHRDSIARGTRIDPNWSASPPRELWRRDVGPGWSSFAVSQGLIYTQEQRGEDEVVSCYNLADGQPVWQHRDATRFWESNAGPGPRGTPTLHEGRAYTFGATGIVNALDAATGKVIWSRNAAADVGKKAPEWGFSSSPLVIGDVVIVAVTGTLAGYDRATGAPRWTGPADGKSYSSPHRLEIDGVTQVVLMSGVGATSVAPADGRVLWQHAWPGWAIVQPAQIAPGELLLSTSDRLGARRIEVARTAEGWTTKERWTSTRLKAYFNDFVLHRGHAYGFDGGILTCIDLETGERRWKGGRYGSGQVLLLADQDVLLVVSEQGGLGLVQATPGEFKELAQVPALKGKTWNHPVLAGDVLLVRNDREMVAFRLARSAPKT